jgi:hypothetical protein
MEAGDVLSALTSRAEDVRDERLPFDGLTYCFGMTISEDIWKKEVRPESRIPVLDIVIGKDVYAAVGLFSGHDPFIAKLEENIQRLGLPVGVSNREHFQLTTDHNRVVTSISLNNPRYHPDLENHAIDICTIIPVRYKKPQVAMSYLNQYLSWSKVVGEDRVTAIETGLPEPGTFIDFQPTKKAEKFAVRRTLEEYQKYLERLDEEEQGR